MELCQFFALFDSCSENIIAFGQVGTIIGAGNVFTIYAKWAVEYAKFNLCTQFATSCK